MSDPTSIEEAGTISDDGRTLTLDWHNFCELADDAEVTARQPWRWGTVNTLVFKHREHHWEADLRVHTQDGWQNEGAVSCVRVIKVPKTVMVWEPG